MWFSFWFSCLGFIDFYRTSGFVVFIISFKCSVIYVLKYFSLPPSKSFPSGTHMLDHFILYCGSPNLFYYQSLYPLGALGNVVFILLCLQIYFSFVVSNMQPFPPSEIFISNVVFFMARISSWFFYISHIPHIMITFSLNTWTYIYNTCFNILDC